MNSPTAPRFADVSCSQCGRSFGPGDHGFSHCASHRPLPTVDVTVMDEYEQAESETVMEYSADFMPYSPATRSDPEERASYEIMRMRLHVTEDMRAFVTDCCAIRVSCGKTVFVSINPDEIGRDVIALDDCDLAEELSSYLMESGT